MHEYSIVQALLERVEAEARVRHAAAVHRLSVRVGELSGVDVRLLNTAYMAFRERTICHSAELDVRSVPARWEFPECGEEVRVGTMLRCACCGAPARLSCGDEIILDRIEMEVP
jgi:hydrogenase nickel incorporation protein HypA/HybF